MIFKILRQIFRDSEHEQIQNELAEARGVISEFREMLLNQTKTVDEKPDVEFIALLWASIGFAMAVARNAFEKAPSDVTAIGTPQEAIWLVIALAMTMFVILNVIFAIELTKKYASSKPDNGYQFYSQTISAAIIIVLIGSILLAVFDGLL